ncbi:hypothetical protein N656DRAFT_778690, partial [Canariomyces notabilis]
MPLSSRTSPAALRTIRDAFEGLRQIVSAGDRADWDSTTLDNVRHAIHLVENQLAARQSLRNMRRLMPLFEGLGYYSKSIEVLCNGTPYLPWLWAPIKVILKVASDYVEAFETIVKAYSRIAEPLRRFKTLDQAYSTNPDVQQTLAVFYADILRFHKEAYQVVCRNGFQVLFLSWWGRFQRRFDGIIEDLKEHESVVDKTANAVNIYEAKRMRDTVSAWRQEFLAKMSAEETEHTSAQYLAIIGLLKTDGSDQARIFESISDEAQKYPGTCAWVTQQAKMSSWMRCRPESSFLILHGHPGTGKSVLATQVATFLRSGEQSLVFTHFCTYSDMASMEYDQVLRSILTQLIRSNTDLVAHAYQELVLKKKTPSPAVLDQLLRTLIPAASPLPSKVRYIHIVVDGLDQCSEDTQGKVITLLERIVTTASTSGSTVCKVLVSARLTPVIRRKLRNKTTLSLADEKVNLENAIRQYTNQRLQSLSPRLSQAKITDDDIREMGDLTVTKADGMFLWARLVLDYLGTNLSYLFTREEVLKAAHSLPRELSEFYGRILTQLTSQLDERSVARMQLILRWIAFAKRPLRRSEFRSALAFSLGVPDISEIVPSYVFDGLASLVEERRDSSFAFIHVSVKDFLQSPESTLVLDEKVALYEQGLATASCLLSGFRWIAPRSASVEPLKISRIIRGLHAFHIYSTQFWVEYLLSIASTNDGIDTGSPFFLQSHQLAEELLSQQQDSSTSLRKSIASLASDSRLVHLEPYPNLYTVVATILMEKRQNYLEGIKEDGTTCTVKCDAAHHLRSLMLHYQQTIRDILNQRVLPGVTMQDLDGFKQDFRSTAFTCRLWSCPSFATGFETEELRFKHEVCHRRILCDVPGCQYPPFSSVDSLKAHKSKCHLPASTSGPGRRGIRKSRDRLPTPSQSSTAARFMGRPGSLPYPTDRHDLTLFHSDSDEERDDSTMIVTIPRPSSPQSSTAAPVPFRTTMDSDQLANAVGGKAVDAQKRSAGIAGVPQPPNAPGAQVQLQQNQPGLPPGYTYPIFQVTPQDMEAFRKHPKVATMSDESLYEFIKRAKRDNFYKRSWEAYNAQNQGNANPPAGGQKTTPQIPQIPVTQPGSVTPIQQQNLRQNAQQQAAQMKPPGVPAADAVTTAASATPNNVRPPPNPSPAPAPKSLRRPSPDDSNEASSQPSSAMQRASSQLEVRPPTAAQKLSPEQIAKLPPDQKAAAMRKQVQQGQHEYAYEISRLKEIQRQALQGHQQQPGVEIAMSGSELQETRHRIAKARGNMDMLRGQGILQWYRLTKDDARATMFFKVRFKIVSQFLDGEKMTQMRPSLTISKDELDQFISMTDGMLRELPIALKANQGAAGSAQPGNQRPSQPAPAAAPLSAANLEEQTQALKQAQNRTIPKTAQPPAAPTTAQPPFQFGAHKSPARNPEYFSEQRITPANLVLPPRKKAKTAAAQKSPPVTQTQAAGPSSPQTKAPSPTVGRKAEPVKAPPKLVCPEPGCEMNSMGFQSEEALNAHREEEHVKPYENPYGFLQEQITSALGLDAQGQPKPAQQLNSQEPAALAAPPMSASVSKQGQTPRSKPESAATPMSRGASMRRQGSAAGAKAGEVVG